MDFYEKYGEMTIVWGEDETEAVEALIQAGFELCLVKADGAHNTWVIMKKSK